MKSSSARVPIWRCENICLISYHYVSKVSLSLVFLLNILFLMNQFICKSLQKRLDQWKVIHIEPYKQLYCTVAVSFFVAVDSCQKKFECIQKPLTIILTFHRLLCWGET